MTVALLDGDSLVYRCGFAVEKTFYGLDGPHGFEEFDSAKAAKEAAAGWDWLDPVIWTRKEVEPLDHCLATVRNSLEKTRETLGAKVMNVYIAGKDNFRERLWDGYKANRLMLTKPKYYLEIREYLQKNWGARIIDGIESDDAIAIQHMEFSANKMDSVIVTQDKDLNQIPGRHYNWVTGEEFNVSPEQGIRFFYSQLLAGDATDNLKGIPGIGTAKAKAIIEGCKTPRDLAQASLEAYQRHFGHTADGEVDLAASLTWILRKPNESHPFWRHLGREKL